MQVESLVDPVDDAGDGSDPRNSFGVKGVFSVEMLEQLGLESESLERS